MKKIIVSIVAVLWAVGMWAVPAYPGWQTKRMADGSEVQVRLIGDEFYSFWESKDGQLVQQQANGTFVATNEPRPTAEQIQAHRAKGMKHRVRKEIGVPNLAPKGVVILVNFADSVMKPGHNQALFDDMCNSKNCTTNAYNGINYGSAAQYFDDQSNGAYRPIFDVFGPVTLPHEAAYYGEQGEVAGETVYDLYIADFVIDATTAADEAGCDFTLYDSDDDGEVDFVYFIYAGQGQAAGGESWTIWPHNWNLEGALSRHRTHCTEDCYDYSGYFPNKFELDGKIINSYACSAELDVNKDLGGIGTLCHEFGHVMGLPDLYDIDFGYIKEQGLYPGEWDIMSGGNYNGGMHCPPNYDPWEKHFFGWTEPVNLGNEASVDTLYANGTDQYNVFQVNKSGELQGPTTAGESFYLENRQLQGWDSYLPGHGLVVWRIDYSQYYWEQNAPNSSNTPDAPRFNVVSAGESEWSDIENKPVTYANEVDGLVIINYIQEDTSDLPDPIWNDWAYYDNGTRIKGVGYTNRYFYWGVMFPKYTLGKNALTKVKIYETTTGNTQPLTIKIYVGGFKPTEENLVYTETVNPAGTTGWHEITLQKPVRIDRRRNLWVIIGTQAEGSNYPTSCCADSGDPNGRWISGDGINWKDIAESNLNYTWMLRAYVEDEEQGIEEISIQDSDASGQKIIYDGQLYIFRDGKIFNILGTRVK